MVSFLSLQAAMNTEINPGALMALAAAMSYVVSCSQEGLGSTAVTCFYGGKSYQVGESPMPPSMRLNSR
jgi:hypothetical protein